MSRRYTHTLSMSLGGDVPTWEGEATVSYTVAWGSPERGRFGPVENYEPGSPAEIEDIRVEQIDGRAPDDDFYGRESAKTLIGAIEANEALLDDLILAAGEQAASDHADALEARAEARAERLAEGF